ncbi:hypothetical protein RDI58_025815 [Solanum bulbocastanum]|uniref:Uncharacterized protein n=1 Tax=Solanum bulbocastanum TaxID=147425 RepID=A0AAN8Y4R1_SOLBU
MVICMCAFHQVADASPTPGQ